MSGNIFGNVLKVATFGESHGVALGCVVDGVPAGIRISAVEIQKELDRRRPGQSKITSPRKESDRVEILSGIFEGKTLGTPIALLIRNENQKSSDYSKLKNIFRPGHADFTWEKKFGIRDFRGGGRSSGRETAARVAAGAIARKILDSQKIKISAFAAEIAGVPAEKVGAQISAKMEAAILAAQKSGDSVGGVVEIRIANCPAGLGAPVFDKISARLGAALFSIGAVKAVEFGAGFESAKLCGSEMNLRSSGIAGGITDGSEIIIRIAVRPTASIAREQSALDTRGKMQKIKITGRHDPCIVPRIIPVAEAMVAITLADALLASRTDRI
ncbi:MAG: chorismate synthase [Patescibacteria group bacterium]